MFVLFGAFLTRSGAGEFILELAQALARRLIGGPGYVAVFGSAMMGTISGSTVANVAATGVFTIPMMKRAGFPARFAAATEAAASTGGQIMPPLMGAGAFVMASYTGISYLTIIAVSVLPALLYFWSVTCFVRIQAKRLNLNSDLVEGPGVAEVVRRGGLQFFLPIAVLMGLLIWGYTPTYCAGVAIIALIATSWLRKGYGMGPRAVYEALAQGARDMTLTAVLLVGVGIVVNAIATTGIGNTFSLMINQWAGGSLFIALILVGIASLVLGMGLPVTASYVVLATLSAQVPPDIIGTFKETALSAEALTVALLSAHMIVFWLSQDSGVTPPVCLTAFAAAAIAGTPPMRTGFTALKLAKGLYIVPFLFAYTPLLGGKMWLDLQVAFFAFFGIYALAGALEGYLESPVSWLLRIVLFALGCMMMWPNMQWLHITGLVLFGLILYRNVRASSAPGPATAQP